MQRHEKWIKEGKIVPFFRKSFVVDKKRTQKAVNNAAFLRLSKNPH